MPAIVVYNGHVDVILSFVITLTSQFLTSKDETMPTAALYLETADHFTPNLSSLPRANNPLKPTSDMLNEILLAVRLDRVTLARVPRPSLALEQVVPRDRVRGLHAEIRGRDVVNVRLVQGGEDGVVGRQAHVVPV